MVGNVILSARMQAVARMVSPGNRVCDTGCDHGYVSIYLVQQKISPGALAMDINAGPLKRAEEHVKQAGLSGYITLRRSDGLKEYQPLEAETLICAGMGGRLMQRILEREPEKTESFKELILQPQSEIPAFRAFLRGKGYGICREDMILEENKFYPVIKAIPGFAEAEADTKSEAGTEADTGTKSGADTSCPWKRDIPGLKEIKAAFGIEDVELADRYGPLLLAAGHSVLIKYLQREWESSLRLKDKLELAGDGRRISRRLTELHREMACLRAALMICGCRM